MSDEDRINPGHTQVRKGLRLVGPLTLGVGVLFMIVGIGSFFSSFGSFGPPRYFWCCFVGMPLIMVGVVMCQFGFMGAITRYQAGEVAPVGKDTFNYMADGTQQGVRTMATAIGAGLADASNSDTLDCPSCGHTNDQDARYCDECGAAMRKACPSCGEQNDGDAKFCNSCGSRLSTDA